MGFFSVRGRLHRSGVSGRRNSHKLFVERIGLPDDTQKKRGRDGDVFASADGSGGTEEDSAPVKTFDKVLS